jgi:hypothetical protein
LLYLFAVLLLLMLVVLFHYLLPYRNLIYFEWKHC